MDNLNKDKNPQLLMLMEQLKETSPTEQIYNAQQSLAFARSMSNLKNHYSNTFSQAIDLEKKISSQQTHFI